MKRIITLLITLCITSYSYAQMDRNLHRAHKYFNRTYYSKSIPLYEKELEDNKSFEVIRNLADSYYFTNNMNKAAYYYKLLFRRYQKIIEQPYYFRYANTLKAIGDYKKAYDLLRPLYKEEELQKLEKSIQYLENVAAIGNRYHIENLAINTPYAEFAAIQKGDRIIFSTPNKEDGLHKRFGWTGNNYLDIYQVHSNSLNDENSISPFSTNINTKVHESNIVFTKDGKTAYFTRNNLVKGKRKKDNKKITHVQIYKAEFVDGKWKNITSLPFNNNKFSTEHPALSNDEKTLYFASDMPGGHGSFDLYKVAIYNNNQYGTPKNLGAIINTDKNEQFPFVSEDNKLYFSSNGHPGFGSLDVFVSTIDANSYSKPDNVGFPINSGYDDFSFNINSTTKEGFFASNRPGGKGSDDIYKIKEEQPLNIQDCHQFISGIITDIDTNEILVNTLISIENNENTEIAKIHTDEKGKFFSEIACEMKYIVKAFKQGYEKKQRVLEVRKERKKNNDASMALKSLLQIEKEKQQAIALQKIEEQELQKKEAQQLKIAKQNKTKEIIAKEVSIVPQKDKLIIKTEDINFDYKLWYLRRDTKKAIDKVVQLMKKYPDMVVEVGTHSDIRGNNRYNLELSQKRADAVRIYFMENGIEPDRISSTGYGETQPLIPCKTEDTCSEEQHELNRRCEFVIKKIL